MTATKETLGASTSGDPETPLSLRIISYICGLFLIITGAIILFVPYTRSERVQGRVEAEPGVIKVYAESNSVVLTRHVESGDFVKKGQALMTMSADRQLGSGTKVGIAYSQQSDIQAQTLRQEMANIHSLYEAEKSLIATQISRKKTELIQIQANVAIQERLFKLAADSYQRRSALTDKGFMSAGALADEERNLLSAEGAYEGAKKELIATQSAMDELLASSTMLVRRREKELFPLTRALSTTSQGALDHEAKQEFLIVAAADGIVAAVLPKPGDTVLEKDLLVSISPQNAKFIVNLYVPSSAIGFLEKRNPVRLRYETYPYQKFGEYSASVINISTVAIDKNDFKLSSLEADHYFRVKVLPNEQKVHAYGKDFSLHDGLKVEADIEVETRKIFQWVLEPFYAKFYGK